MKNKIMFSAILVALTGMSANVAATSINMRHEFSPKYDGQDAKNKDRIAVSHRFANGLGFEVEAKWASGVNAFDIDEFKGSGQQANISYKIKLSNSFTLTPQYKWETSDSKAGHQFNLKLGYKINSDWSTSFRHRYHYEVKNSGESNSHYNRWSLGLGYKGINDWSFGASTDYTFNQEQNGPRWEDKQAWFSEVNFKAEYRGLNNGWRPFTELGFSPYKSGGEYDFDNGNSGKANDAWRPRIRIGMKYVY